MEITLGERQAEILEAVVREHIRTAEPVGSLAVAERYRIAASPATIRNDMGELEAEGFIRQPHTSAGRVPTERAYRYYVAHCVRERAVPRRETEQLRHLWSLHGASPDLLKLTAKALAAFSAESVLLAFGKRDVYYTGLSNLFAQPEFGRSDLVVSMSVVIDRLDEVVAELFPEVPRGIEVLLGTDNPLGGETSLIVTRCPVARAGSAVFGILGPTRMDYETNIARLKYVQEGLARV